MWILWKRRLCEREFCLKWYFQNVNFVENETLRMRFLSKMRLWKCEFCQKWDFGNVNFVKCEIFKMWTLSKMGFWKYGFYANWYFQNAIFWRNMDFFETTVLHFSKIWWSYSARIIVSVSNLWTLICSPLS